MQIESNNGYAGNIKIDIDDGEFVVNIIPNEYSITGVNNNIMKPIYSYTVNVEFKRKLIKKKQK